jgi:hypothetical protein
MLPAKSQKCIYILKTSASPFSPDGQTEEKDISPLCKENEK